MLRVCVCVSARANTQDTPQTELSLLTIFLALRLALENSEFVVFFSFGARLHRCVEKYLPMRFHSGRVKKDKGPAMLVKVSSSHPFSQCRQPRAHGRTVLCAVSDIGGGKRATFHVDAVRLSSSLFRS